MIRISIFIFASLLAGCASNLPKAAEEASDALKKSSEALKAVEQQALHQMRLRRATGLQLDNTAGANSDLVKQLRESSLGDSAVEAAVLVRDLLCGHINSYTALIETQFAARTFSGTGETLKKLAKAPDGGVAAKAKAIFGDPNAGISAPQKPQPTPDEVRAQAATDCQNMVVSLVKDLQSKRPHYSYERGDGVGATSASAAIQSVLTALEPIEAILTMIEENKRAHAIHQYIKQNGSALSTAVNVLNGQNDTDSPAGSTRKGGVLKVLDDDLKRALMAQALWHARATLDLCCAEGDYAEKLTVQQYQLHSLAASHAEKLVNRVEVLEAVNQLALADPSKGIGKALSKTVDALSKAAKDRWRISWANLEALVRASAELDEQVQELEAAKKKLEESF